MECESSKHARPARGQQRQRSSVMTHFCAPTRFEFSLYKLEQALLEEEDAERRAENGERGAPASGEASDSKSPRIGEREEQDSSYECLRRA